VHDLGLVVTNTAGNTSMFDDIVEVGVPYVRLVSYYDLPNYLSGRFKPDVQAAFGAGLEPYGNLMPRNYETQYSAPSLQDWKDEWEASIDELPGVEHWAILNEPNHDLYWPTTWGRPLLLDFWDEAAAIIKLAGKTLLGPELAGNDPSSGNPVTWLDDFLGDISTQPDILTVHRYGTAANVNSYIQDVANVFSGPIWLTETAHSDLGQTEDQQWTQLDGVMGYQAQMSDWQRTYAFHWYAADEPSLIIRGTRTECELRQLVVHHLHGPYQLSPEGKGAACDPNSTSKIYEDVQQGLLFTDCFCMNLPEDGYYGVAQGGAWKIIIEGAFADSGSCP
jgi:hypothetical protein